MRTQPRIKNVIFIVAVVVFLPFTWVVVFTGPDMSTEDLLEKRLAEMRDRLQHAESLNRERETDLHALKTQMNILMGAHKHGNSTENGTNVFIPKEARELLANLTIGTGDIQPPSMFQYLPHLIGHPEGLKPAFKMAKGRMGASVALGIPTIKRERDSYLFQTLESLIDGLSPEEKEQAVIIVFIAEPNDLEYVKQTASELERRFSVAIGSGLLEVISPPAVYYPDFNKLRETFGDPLERVKWRTKQNLDFSFLMMYAKLKATYYCQLEDDIVTKAGYLSIMKGFALNQKSEDWMLLEFSHLGFIGKLFKSSDLPMVVEFFLMFHKDKPIDWLLDHLLYVKVCNPERDSKHCQRSISELRRRFKPSLFQHIGTHSSLKGKVQKLKDKDFGKAQLHRAHLNPTAEVSTSIKIYQHYSLDRAYMGETFFWGLIPEEGDFIMIKFQPPIRIEKYLFKSGNPEHPGDRFFNTTVEVLPVDHSKSQEGILDNKNPEGRPYPRTEDGFFVINKFDHVTGMAEGTVDPDKFGEVEVIRLHVKGTSLSWVVLSEIHIKELKER